MVGVLSDDEITALGLANDARIQTLADKGVGIVVDRQGHYMLLLLEALVGPGVVQRCRSDNEQWLAGVLDEAEPEADRQLREQALLGPAANGNTSNREQRRHPT